MQKAIGVWVLVTPRPQGPSRRSCYLNDFLLTIKTIYIHKFYFLQSTSLGGQIKKKMAWLVVESRLTRDSRLTWSRGWLVQAATLYLITSYHAWKFTVVFVVNHVKFSSLSSNRGSMDISKVNWRFGFENTCWLHFRSSVALRLYHEFPDENGRRVRGHISQVR